MTARAKDECRTAVARSSIMAMDTDALTAVVIDGAKFSDFDGLARETEWRSAMKRRSESLNRPPWPAIASNCIDVKDRIRSAQRGGDLMLFDEIVQDHGPAAKNLKTVSLPN